MIWKFQQCQAPEKQELIYIYDDIMIVIDEYLILEAIIINSLCFIIR
jgi:hypothetical protein